MTDAERKKIFSNNLLHILNIQKKSQIEVANAIGVSQQTFNTWCRGVALPRMGKVQLLADFFGINMSDLIDVSTPAATTSLPPDQASILAKYGKLSSAGKDDLHKRADELIALGYTEEEEIKKKEEA